MTTQPEVLRVPDLAKMLSRTEASIRASVNRGGDDLPPRLMMGRRICWSRATVEAWLREREQPKQAKAGRKAKAGA